MQASSSTSSPSDRLRSSARPAARPARRWPVRASSGGRAGRGRTRVADEGRLHATAARERPRRRGRTGRPGTVAATARASAMVSTSDSRGSLPRPQAAASSARSVRSPVSARDIGTPARTLACRGSASPSAHQPPSSAGPSTASCRRPASGATPRPSNCRRDLRGVHADLHDRQPGVHRGGVGVGVRQPGAEVPATLGDHGASAQRLADLGAPARRRRGRRSSRRPAPRRAPRTRRRACPAARPRRSRPPGAGVGRRVRAGSWRAPAPAPWPRPAARTARSSRQHPPEVADRAQRAPHRAGHLRLRALGALAVADVELDAPATGAAAP